MQLFKENGVQITPTIVKSNHIVEVSYDGILASSGADEVYLRCGVSEQSSGWKNLKDIKMEKHANGKFCTDVTVGKGEHLNMCFHDAANHWDNNNGKNYTFNIHHS
ncbi:MAG: carbohydrate-binding protein [Marinisporobacter sp.]|jgi:hypothetical protein|nr:carbohydrate-binding protein [Marinisporobacter sp.]